MLPAAFASFAQQEHRVRRIGYLSGGSLQSNVGWLAAFREGMSQLRWVEGRDYLIDARYTNGVLPAGPALAGELIANRPDLLLTSGDGRVRELTQRTKTIPIVFAVAQDPVGGGLVASLQRPGGNVTGLTTLASELATKRLQLLKEGFPRVVRVVLLFEPANVSILSQVKEIEDVAVRMRISVTPIELRQAADIEGAFKRGAALGAQAYLVAQGSLINAERQALIDRSLGTKVPTMFSEVQFVDAGGLMSYAPSSHDNFRRAAGYVDKILKGAKPGDLPIEQPTKFELVLNMKTAKTLGIQIPNSILLRADRVIE